MGTAQLSKQVYNCVTPDLGRKVRIIFIQKNLEIKKFAQLYGEIYENVLWGSSDVRHKTKYSKKIDSKIFTNK